MAQKKTTKNKPATKPVIRILRAGLFLIAMIILFFMFVDQQQLPPALKNNKAISYGYDLQKKAFPPKAVIDKTVQKDTSQGYTPKAREDLEKIISKGAEDL